MNISSGENPSASPAQLRAVQQITRIAFNSGVKSAADAIRREAELTRWLTMSAPDAMRMCADILEACITPVENKKEACNDEGS